MPFKIGHVRISHKRSRCFLVSGSDKFHLYQQDANKHQYVEINVADYFPSLPSLPGGLAFEIRAFQLGNICAVGCQDGTLHCSANGTLRCVGC